MTAEPTTDATERLTDDELARLKGFSADQLFWARSAVEGVISDDYTDQSIRCFSPELGTVAGYAATTEWTTVDPESPDLDFLDYYEWLESTPGPKVAVMQDVDPRGGPRAAGFGSMQARTIRKLGVVGVLSSVGIQKPHLVREAGMPVWSTGVAPAHGPYHLVRYGAPVVVGSVRWSPGDLVFADVTGAIRIPAAIARETLHRAEADAAAPGPGYFDIVDAPDFTVAKLRAWIAQHPSIYPPVDPAKVDAWWDRNGAGLAPRSEGISRPKQR
jgi:regulator of RNase E activity RraA